MASAPELGFFDPTIPAINSVAKTMDGMTVEEQSTNGAWPKQNAEKYTTLRGQIDFLDTAFEQAKGVEYAPRVIRGPRYADFNSILQGLHAALHEIDPALTPDSLFPPSYQSEETHRYIRETPGMFMRVHRLRQERLQQLKLQGGRGLLSLVRQDLPRDVLDVPDYHKQGEHLHSIEASMLCVNACFRMVHHGITGWAPYEDVLNTKIKEEHGKIVVEDSKYYTLLQTHAFKEASDHKQVKVVEVLGADFDTIRKLTAGVKDKYPHAKVFAVASLGSQTATDEDTWHSVVLVGKEGDEVICHDPAVSVGRSYKRMSLATFARRWAITYNRTLVTIAI